MVVNDKLNLTMLCDFYELTMGAGYFANGYADRMTYFDLFFKYIYFTKIYIPIYFFINNVYSYYNNDFEYIFIKYLAKILKAIKSFCNH